MKFEDEELTLTITQGVREYAGAKVVSITRKIKNAAGLPPQFQRQLCSMFSSHLNFEDVQIAVIIGL